MDLPENEELTPLVAGHRITAMARTGDLLGLTLDDGSLLNIRTGGAAPAEDAVTDRVIKRVRQGGTQLLLEFADHSSVVIKLAEETSSVLMRDAEGNFGYSD